MMLDSAMDVGESAVREFVARATALETEIAKVIVGQREVIRDVLVALLGGGHVLLEGVPGLGKTLLVRTLAGAVNLRFARIQFTPDLMPADVIGTNVVVEDETGQRSLRFQAGPIFANVVLADEINRATPKTQSALLEAMQERTVTVGDATRPLPAPFFVLATQNPLEMEGTYPLPEAQLDRFFFKVLVPFPPADVLRRIGRQTIRPDAPTVNPVVTGDELLRLQRVARAVPIASHLEERAVAIVLATHPESELATEPVRQFVRYGASPRGLQALLIGSQVRALLEGRYNVAGEDLEAIAASALRHRLILNFEGQAEGISPDEIVGEIVRQTAAIGRT